MSVSHLKRKLDDEGRARARTAVDVHRAAQLLDDAAHDVQAQAEPFVAAGRDRALERFEDPAVQLGGNSQSVVGHLQTRAAARAVTAGANDHGPSLAVLDRV